MTCLNFGYHFWSGYYYTSCPIFYVLIIITMVSIDPIYFILAELDDTTAAGLNGFAMLQKFSSGYDQKELATKLEKAMQYIKTKYQSHLTQDSLIADILQYLHLVIKRMNCSYQTQKLQMKYAVTVSIYVKVWMTLGSLLKSTVVVMVLPMILRILFSPLKIM